MDVFDEPVGEVRKGGTSELFRESLFNVLVAGQNVGHGFGMPVLANRLASVECFHAGGPFRNVEIEGTFPEFLRKD